MGSGAHAGVYPRDPSFRKEIISRLAKVPGLEVYERHDIPQVSRRLLLNIQNTALASLHVIKTCDPVAQKDKNI